MDPYGYGKSMCFHVKILWIFIQEFIKEKWVYKEKSFKPPINGKAFKIKSVMNL